MDSFEEKTFISLAAYTMVFWGFTEKDYESWRVIWRKQGRGKLKLNWFAGVDEFEKFLATPCCVKKRVKRGSNYVVEDPLFEIWGEESKKTNEELTKIRVGDYMALLRLCSLAYGRPMETFAPIMFREDGEAHWVHLNPESLGFLSLLVSSKGVSPPPTNPVRSPTKSRGALFAQKKKSFERRLKDSTGTKVAVSVGSARFEPPVGAVAPGGDEKVLPQTVDSIEQASEIYWQNKEPGASGQIRVYRAHCPRDVTASN